MTRFERLKQILDEAIEGNNIGAHKAFWRTLDLEQFKIKKIYGHRLVVPGDLTRSKLVLALRGLFPFGEDIGVPNADYPRMPIGFKPVSEENILFIEEWIRNGCPDDEWIVQTDAN